MLGKTIVCPHCGGRYTYNQMVWDGKCFFCWKRIRFQKLVVEGDVSRTLECYLIPR